jgi:hypothetical protein
MSTFIHNSAFKAKMGSVPNTLNIPPEKGALLFDESQNAPVVGDGINWLTFAPSIDAIALTSNSTEYVDAMTAAVAVEPADFFSNVLYNLGTALTPSIPAQTVVANTTGSYRFNYLYWAKSTVPNTKLDFDIAINGTPLGVPIINLLKTKDTRYTFQGQFVVPGITATDILTLWIKTDKTCTLTRGGQEIGIALEP